MIRPRFPNLSSLAPVLLLATTAGGMADVEINVPSSAAVGDGTLGPIPADFRSVGGTVVFPAHLQGSANPAAIVRSSWYGLEAIAQQGQSATGNGTFQQLPQAATNYEGDIAFTAAGITGSNAGTADDAGVFLQRMPTVPALPEKPLSPPAFITWPLETIAREGQALPGATNGVFRSFSSPQISASRQITFRALVAWSGDPHELFAGEGLFASTSTGLKTITLPGDTILDGTGTFSAIGASQPYEDDTLGCVFQAELVNTPLGSDDNTGIFRSTGTPVITLAREGAAAPGGGYFDSFRTLTSRAGVIAFHANTRTSQSTGSINLAPGEGIYQISTTNVLTIIAKKGDPSPNSGGPFLAFGSPSCGASNLIAFTASRSAGSGVFLSKNGTISTIASQYQATPEGRGVFQAFHEIAVNPKGAVVFAADVLDQEQTVSGIYLHDGITLTLLARTGDQIEGRTISELSFLPESFNKERELSLLAQDSSGDRFILLHAPQVRMLKPAQGGSWHWDSTWNTGARPGKYSHVTIELTANNMFVSAATSPFDALRTARSIRIVASGPNLSAMRMYNNYLFTHRPLTIEGRMFVGSGIARVPQLINQGYLQMSCEVLGDYTQGPNAWLWVEFQRSSTPTPPYLNIYGAIHAQGHATLDGELRASYFPATLIPYTTPQDRFTVLRHAPGMRTGTFQNAKNGDRIITDDDYCSFRVNYTDTEVYLDDFQATDTDSDGIPDRWMDGYFRHIDPRADDRSRPDDDADGDGLTNRQEYLAGTDPKNAMNALLASVVKEDSGLTIKFPSKYLRKYVIETKTDLTQGTWTPLHSDIIGNGLEVSYPLPGAFSDERRFYRVRLVTE